MGIFSNKKEATHAVNAVESGVEFGQKQVNRKDIERELASDRKLASLFEAKSIKKGGWYWISTEEVPIVSGYYGNDKRGVFRKFEDWEILPDWSNRIFVSNEAAEKAAKGEKLLTLCIRDDVLDDNSRLAVTSHDWPTVAAIVASVPKAQVGLADSKRA